MRRNERGLGKLIAMTLVAVVVVGCISPLLAVDLVVFERIDFLVALAGCIVAGIGAVGITIANHGLARTRNARVAWSMADHKVYAHIGIRNLGIVVFVYGISFSLGAMIARPMLVNVGWFYFVCGFGLYSGVTAGTWFIGSRKSKAS